MSQSDILRTISYCRSIVTMSLSCTVSEILDVKYWSTFQIWVRGQSKSLKYVTIQYRSHTIS